ncbi:MAG: RIO1 family regulatory kinase/ATPase [Myxococcota bacterium]
MSFEFDGDPAAERQWSYRPSVHEQGWLEAALTDWFDDETLEDVLFAVRGGKEANVYACRGGPAAHHALVAAKVYRPRKFRELSNDAIYREGRGVLDEQGHGVRARDRRMSRAIRRGTRLGKRAAHTSWVMHEMSAMQRLYDAGVRVPEPLAANPRAVLMEFIGDEEGAAPTLQRLRPSLELASRLYDQLLDAIERLLELGLVHGDLSPYNVLVWNDEAVVIDFPQIVDVMRNPHGPRLFLRDVERIGQGPSLRRPVDNPRALADAIWCRVFGTDGVPDGAVF